MAQKTLSVKLSLNDKQFQSALKKSTRQLKRFGASMQRTGRTLSRNLTLPLLAFGVVSVRAFDKQAKAIAQVEAGIKSTGGAAGFTSEKLQKMASELQAKTLFGDEEILKGATSQLLTFTNIAGEQFARTQVAALNLATRLDGDLKSASIQLGKALNDPIANLSALSRSGIQFSEEQKKVIKELAETNRLAEAQTLILDELQKQYGGAAEAAAQAGAGGFKQLQNTLGDISEDFGKIIVDGIEPLKNTLKSLANALSSTSKETKQSMVIFGAIAAVLGPVLIVFGLLIKAFATVKSFILLSLVPAFKMLIKVLANLTPQGRIISGIILAAGFIISHFEPLKKTFNDIKDSILGVKDAKEELDKSLDTTIQTSTQSPEDARANMMRAIQAGVIGFKPKTKPSAPKERTPDPNFEFKFVEPIKALNVELKLLKTLTPVIEDFEDSLSGMDIVANQITQSFKSFGNVFQSVFAQALQSQEGFFKSFVEGTKRALAALAAQISSMLILNALLGGTGLGNLLGFTGIGGFGGIGQVISGVGSVDANSVGVGGSLRSMMNTGGGVEVFGTLRGADIILSSDRARNNRTRTRGY